MKTYLRLLSFSRPYADFVPLYAVYATLGVVFGIANFTLVIPMLNLLFGTTDVHTAAAPAALPAFAFSLDYAKELFNYYFAGQLARHGQQGTLAFVCGLIIGSVFLSNLFRYLGGRLLARVRARVVRNVRGALFGRITELELGYFSNERKGDLISRLTNDVQEVEISVVNTLTAVFKEPLNIVGIFVVLFTMSARLTLFSLVLLPLSGGIIASVSKRLRRHATISQTTLGAMLSVMEETLSGMRVIKAFNARRYVLGKFAFQNDLYARTTQSIDNTRDLASPFSEFAGVTVVAGLLYYGGSLVLSGQAGLSASAFITYIILFSQILTPAKNLSGAFSGIQRGLVAGGRVLSIIDTEPAIRDRPDAIALPPFQEQVELRGVSFHYGDVPVLYDLNLTVTQGPDHCAGGPQRRRQKHPGRPATPLLRPQRRPGPY